MDDTVGIDHRALYQVAEGQAGYFTAGQAGAAGMSRSTLSYHSRAGGRFQKVQRGVYRLRDFPSSPHEHVVATWLALHEPDAVVSHESALELYDLSDIIADLVHVTVSRAARWRRQSAGARLHFTSQPIPASDRRTLHGLPVTTVERAIADVATQGVRPEQVEVATSQAIERGLTTPTRLRRALDASPPRARAPVDRALQS